jgi:hypothetical protein
MEKDSIGGGKMIINTDLIYPIGAIYLSVSATNPAILFGGKWEAINSRFLIGTGTATGEGGETYNFTAGATGGEYSHKLTVTEIPAHKHQIKTNNDDWNNSSGGGNFGTTHDGANGWANNNWYTENAGGNGYHNNLPPFLAVYMWKRVA